MTFQELFLCCLLHFDLHHFLFLYRFSYLPLYLAIISFSFLHSHSSHSVLFTIYAIPWFTNASLFCVDLLHLPPVESERLEIVVQTLYLRIWTTQIGKIWHFKNFYIFFRLLGSHQTKFTKSSKVLKSNRTYWTYWTYGHIGVAVAVLELRSPNLNPQLQYVHRNSIMYGATPIYCRNSKR